MSDDTITNINSIDSAITLARESVRIGMRIDELGHPDDAETAIPVFLETNADGATKVEVATEALALLDRRLPGPRRREGSVRLTEVLSLIEYVKRYGDENSVIYADTKALAFSVIFDEHPPGPGTGAAVGAGTGWRNFRAVYACPRSPEWLTWCQSDGKAMKQEEFADFLEARLEDMAAAENYPKPIEVLAVARQLNIRTKGEFRREINPTNGDAILVCKSETDTGSTQIPRAFAIVIPVFESGARYQVEARVRFALVGGVPQFSYTLHRRAEIERDAFGEVRERIAGETGRLMLAGNP